MKAVVIIVTGWFLVSVAVGLILGALFFTAGEDFRQGEESSLKSTRMEDRG